MRFWNGYLTAILLLAWSLANLLGSHPAPPFEKVESFQHLPNTIRLHAEVYSGGLPDGEPAFDELSKLGVQTIISVDGAKPDVELASKHGMRYVHLPHGYDGIAYERAKQLAKAVQSLPKPIYIHCHHGKHRSPAAAVVACVGAGLIPASDSADVLRIAGTSPNYQGLFDAARLARPFSIEELSSVDSSFPSSAKLPAMAEAMVELQLTFDGLARLAQAGWSSIPSDPDLDPAHEALLLKEHYAELSRLEEVLMQAPAFRELLDRAQSNCGQLENAIRSEQAEGKQESQKSRDRAWVGVQQDCTACHRQFRDVPLGQKPKRD